jgi:hypothetical protein
MNPLDDNDDNAFTDALFQQLPEVEPSARLTRQVAQIPLAHPRSNVVFWPFRSVWQPSLALVAAACVGFFAGQSIQELRAANAPEVASLEEGHFDEFGAGDGLASTTTTEADEEIEGLLLLATADFETSDWAETFQTDASDVQEEETF